MLSLSMDLPRGSPGPETSGGDRWGLLVRFLTGRVKRKRVLWQGDTLEWAEGRGCPKVPAPPGRRRGWRSRLQVPDRVITLVLGTQGTPLPRPGEDRHPGMSVSPSGVRCQTLAL